MAASPPHYAFETTPEAGHYLQITPTIYWLRMPLPIALNHINLWLLEEQDGFTVVDTGWASEQTISIWEQIQVRLFKQKPIKRVIVTHMHPDHVGLAGWLTDVYQAPLCMSRAEFLNCHLLLNYTHEKPPTEALQFYQAAGYDEVQLQKYRAHFGQFGQYVRHISHSYQRLRNEQVLKLNGSTWRVVIGEGHSPEHVCLFNEQDNIFIAGDQLLPTISSNVSVWPTEPEANPLEDWLKSCKHLQTLLNDQTLVLPSHGRPFYGATSRLQALIEESETNLAALADFCHEPRRAVDTFSVLFNSPITSSNLMMATGESVAHLHCLRERGLIQETYDKGVTYWQRRPS
ncbi:MBL fold metallo-hydrolase [Thiolinea disciformis]|uniref:MBL fold metallo-hydrolase n=1 Tax=Thiolinea disciformis TaxID=125614 RepID=UPI0003644F7F|nr:MBL fold metallo-hydrolase [Thiolinea disciformis]